MDTTFVRYSCGCIGFRPLSDGQALIVKPCDGMVDESEILFAYRDQTDKTYDELYKDEEREIIDTIVALINAGDVLQRLSFALQLPKLERRVDTLERAQQPYGFGEGPY